MPPARRSNASLLLLCLFAAACSQEPDLRLASNAELIKLIATMQKGGPHVSLGNRAAGELASRPRTMVSSDLRIQLKSGDSDIRCTIAQLLGEFLADTSESRLEDDARKETETSLLALLDQPEERVRASALFGLARGWSVTRPDSVPQPVAASIVSLLESAVAAVRFQASLAAFWIGPAVESVAEVLTTKLQSERDSGVRFALASALGAIGAKHAPAGAVLVSLLDDTEEKVRYSAATSLGDLPQCASNSIPRLRRLLGDASAATDVRCAAALSLVKLVTRLEDVEAVLLDLLESESVFPDHQQLRWLAAMGTLGASAPRTRAARGAREHLETAARGERRDQALVATSSLARIACGERDQGLGERTAASLLEALPGILLASQEDLSSWASEEDTYQPVLESLVDLARWPEMRVDATMLRPLFDALRKSRAWWTREWASKQLQRLE